MTPRAPLERVAVVPELPPSGPGGYYDSDDMRAYGAECVAAALATQPAGMRELAEREGCTLNPPTAQPVAPSAVGDGEPVAWARNEFIRDEDGRPIGTDEPRVVWGSEHPDPDESWWPLFDRREGGK